MCKRLLLSALAVAFSAGAILGAAGPADWVWDGPGKDSGTSARADWVWDSISADPEIRAQGDWVWDRITADPAGSKAEAGVRA
ncbi:hypothetical protein [Streptomyces sp. NPDC002644]